MSYKIMILLACVLISFGTFILMFLSLIYIKKKLSLDIFHRMRRHHVQSTVKKNSDVVDLLIRVYGLIQKLARPLVVRNYAKSLEYKLQQAGLPILGGEFVIVALLGALIVGLLVLLITLDLYLALLSSVLVPVILWLIVLILIKRRLASFTNQLGDCLITISNALRAGYSFQQTIEVISKEMEPPIGEEFARLNHDIVMGVPLAEALDDSCNRVGSSDFELVVTAVLIQREVGGNLAQVLDNISYTIKERIRMKGEILSLTAQGRFSAMVLFILPFAAAIGMYFFNHDDFMLLFKEPLGQIAMAVAFVMEIIGYFVIMRIVNIEV